MSPLSIKLMDLDFKSFPCFTEFPLVFSFAFPVLPLSGTGTVALTHASYTLTVFESLRVVTAFKHPGLFLSECACPALGVSMISSSGVLHPACSPWPPALTCSSLPVLSQSHSQAVPTSAPLSEFNLHFSLPTVHPCTLPALTRGPSCLFLPCCYLLPIWQVWLSKGPAFQRFHKTTCNFLSFSGRKVLSSGAEQKKKMWTVQGNALNPLQSCQNLTSLRR